MKIAILGGSGLLGKELQKIDPTLICTGQEVDITHYKDLFDYLNEINPDIIVNAAAETNSVLIKENPIRAIETNVIGASNVANYCLRYNKRLVYISTDYVYLGTGDHKENDPVFPNNEYAWTKLGGECSSRLVKNHCIIRTSFGDSKFPYSYAFKNVFSSKDYVDVIAPKILKIIKSSYIGVINVGTDKKSIYHYALKRNKKITPIYLDSTKTEQDYSLNLSLFNELFNN